MTRKSSRNSLNQAIGVTVEHWTGCEPPSRSAMQGSFCQLQATDVAEHGEALYKAFASDQQLGNWTYLPYGPFADATNFLAWLSEASKAGDPLFYTVLDSQGTPVGLATYLRIEPAVGVIEVGHIHFSPLMQRTAIATEAMYLMMRRVFDELGYRRYEWKCDALNAPSRAAAERLGFTYEGVFRNATIYKGRNRDTAWFSITDDEWPTIKAMLESWLAVENFDSQGVQVRSLKSCREMLLA